MTTIDNLSYQSGLRKVNAFEKFFYSVITLLVCVIGRSIIVGAVVLFFNSIILIFKSGLSTKRYLKLIRLPFVFLILSTLAIVINFSKTPLDLFSVKVGSVYITSSNESARLALRLVTVAMGSVTSLYFLALTTPVTDILNVLRRLHCPSLVVELMLLIYRFIFILSDTAHAIAVSQSSRLGNISFKTSVKSFGLLGSVLFLRAFKRSSAVYDSMEARCYDGEIRVLNENYPARLKEILLIFFYELFLTAIILYIRYRA